MMNNNEHKIERAATGNEQSGADEMESFELLEQEVERLREELDAERERGLCTLAEFDNYRRRTRQESARAEQAGKRDLLLALLDVMDDFDRALEHIGETSDAVADGLRLVHQRLSCVLESNGVSPFESVGEQFDPIVHEAMGVVDSDEVESVKVFDENRRGYLWNDGLLRPARVRVVR